MICKNRKLIIVSFLSLVALVPTIFGFIESSSSINRLRTNKQDENDKLAEKTLEVEARLLGENNSDNTLGRELKHKVRRRRKKKEVSSSLNDVNNHEGKKDENNNNEKDGECKGAYQQCDGLTYYGSKICCPGFQCEYINDYWWQCNPYISVSQEEATLEFEPVVDEGKEDSKGPQIISSNSGQQEEESHETAEDETKEEETEVIIIEPEDILIEGEEETENNIIDASPAIDDIQSVGPENVSEAEITEEEQEEIIYDTLAPTAQPIPAPTVKPTSKPSLSPTLLPTSEWEPPLLEDEELSEESEQQEPSFELPGTSSSNEYVFWQNEDGTCQNIRKDWRAMTVKEKEFLIDAFNDLKKFRVTYDKISRIHAHSTNFQYAHGNDFFLPWHRWYVLHLEEGVREMGGKYACFRLPYWDWTLDAGNERNSDVLDYYGGMGKSGMRCVLSGPVRSWKAQDGLCIRRVGDTRYRFSGRVELMNVIREHSTYKGSTGFRGIFESGAHSRPHLFLAGTMNTFASPDDPIFWLHHSFVDKVYAMWQDCHDYEKADSTNIPESAFPDNYLDFKMFGTYGVVPRDMHSIETLGYTYETDAFSNFLYLKADGCTWDGFVKPKEGETARYNLDSLSHLNEYSRNMIMREDELYEQCMENNNHDACLRALVEYECETLGESCLPPPEYLATMNMQDEADALAANICSRDCDADSRDNYDLERKV